MSKNPLVELKNVSKWFHDSRRGERIIVLNNLSLDVYEEEAGTFVVLLGPSGCGKSTILNLISGLLSPSAGEVRVSNAQVTRPNHRKSATVPQAYTCFPWLTALGNVEFGLIIQGNPKAERRAIAIEYLNKVGLGDRLNSYPKQMSGGMQQRVAIARTLAIRPQIVLMDEPFGALDAQTRAEMQQMLLQLWEKEANTIIFVTHDITEALLLADRIIVFSPRPAQIVQDIRVPFPRPRSQALVREEDFIDLSLELLELLKKTPASGQVRVSL
ncbi:MAG: ABC transporter ATP-binding protein [Acidobacteriota bacterium]